MDTENKDMTNSLSYYSANACHSAIMPQTDCSGHETKTHFRNRHDLEILTPKPALYQFYMSRDCTQFAQGSRISNYVKPSSH